MTVDKPRRPPSTRRAVADTRLAEFVQVATTTGDDPALDALILRLHIETACRRGGALALRPIDLDPGQCLISLREKGDTTRSQPVSPRRPLHVRRRGRSDLILGALEYAVWTRNIERRCAAPRDGGPAAAGRPCLRQRHRGMSDTSPMIE